MNCHRREKSEQEGEVMGIGELKRRGREKVFMNYWPAVAVSLVLAIMMTDINNYFIHGKRIVWVSVLWTNLLIPSDMMTSIWKIVVRDVLYIFIFSVIEVGGAAFFIRNREERAKAGLVFSGFREGKYKKYVKCMFFVKLELFFWTLMLVIPGIIKAYAFRLVPYILAENPDMKYDEVLFISEDMMRGQKWRAFLLDVSFLGWKVLAVLTFGVLGIFFVGPYIEAADAELYGELKAMRDETYGCD